MTRETKIGLLVGLAFIIVIGILLSDHLTSTTEPQQATLASAGSTVRQATSTPGGVGTGAPVTVVMPNVAPQQTIATQPELTPAAQAVKIVRIGGPSASPIETPAAPVEIKNESSKSETPVAKNDVDSKETARVDTDVPAVDPKLAKVAENNGESLVPVTATPKKSIAGTTYDAQPGDSVSKIVSKLLGSSNKANIAAFVKANPSLDGDPANLQAGRTYKIPATATDPTATRAGASVDAPTNAPLAIAANSDADDAIKTGFASKPAADTLYVYTVKPGDNLTKIARDQLGDPHAVASIQELNSDKLKGTKRDMVLVGMKLKLPGKPVAKAE